MRTKPPDIIQFGISEKHFTDFYQENYRSFCFFANRFLSDPHLAEDLVSEVAVKIWQKLHTIRNNTALKSYFYTSIRNSCLSVCSKKKVIVLDGDFDRNRLFENRNVEEWLIEAETFGYLHAAIDRLPTKCRNVFSKLYVEGKTMSETADELNLSISTIKTHRQRGLRKLREQAIGILTCFLFIYFCQALL